MEKFNGFVIRGFHMDLKAYTLRFEAMCAIVRKMAKLGYNTVLLEYQDKFPFDGDLADIPEEDALSREQIQEFDALCKSIGMEIIPLVQCVGHFRYVLRRKKYSWLADADSEDVLCPSRTESFELFAEMARQIMQLHPSSRYLHIGGDEARLAKDCPVCGDRPVYQRLMGHYRKCVDFVRDAGKTPILWGDMLLAHLELLDELRGRVVVMDWNYASTGARGERVALWGNLDSSDPESWPPLARKLLRDYVYVCEPYWMKPFPYVRFLQDQGFPVIVAPAAQCIGDSYYASKPEHIENCREAVRVAAAANALGVVVTSWSIRRVPWPQTENSLIAAAMAMTNPGVTDLESDIAFALDSFGTADEELAQIPRILGRAAKNLSMVCDVATRQEPGCDVGTVLDYASIRELRKQCWIGNPQIVPLCEKLARAADEAQSRLNLAHPETEEQRLRVTLWQLSIHTARLMSRYVPRLTEKTLSSAEAQSWIAAFEELGAQGENALSPLYTPFAMRADYRARAGVHIEYLRQFLSDD